MIEQGLIAEAQKLVAHIRSLGSGFKILKAQPANHIGVIIADAVLQVGHRWKTHVEKRLKHIESNYPGAATLSGLSRLLATEGAQKLLDWNGKDEQTRFCQTVEFFSNEKVNGITIDTVSQLSKWLASEDNRDRLLTKSLRKDKAGIPKIGDKTADYYRVVVGLPDAVAIDSLIRAFLKDADVRGRSQYYTARVIVQLAAPMLSAVRNTHIRPIDLDQSIWKFQSEKEERKMDKDNKEPVLEVSLPRQVMEQLKTLSREKYGEEPEKLTKFWIIEKLLEQCPPQNSLHVPISPLPMSPPHGQQTLTIREKIKEVVEKNWDYGQPFSRGELITKVREAYPEVKKNEIMPADRAINRLSGYTKRDVGWKKKDPYLFARNDGRFERYDAARHGFFECIDDGKGYKKIIQKNI